MFAQEAPPAVHVVVSDDLRGFSIVSTERLALGLYQAEHNVEGPSEVLTLTARGDEALAIMDLRYQNGTLVYGEAQNQQEPTVAFDFNQNPPRVQWKPAQARALPPPEEIARRSAVLRETGAILRERFGLRSYRGQDGDVTQLLLTGRTLVSVYFRTLGPKGGVYTFANPMGDDTVEVLTQDEYAYAWTISIHKRRALVEKYFGAGLTTTKFSLVWEAGSWRGELLEIQPQLRKATQALLSPVQARQLLDEGSLVLGEVRERFKTEHFTLPLAGFGLP